MIAETIEKKSITEEIINVRYSDIDFDKSLKPFSLLNFFQDIASDNAEKFGFGYSYIYPKNLMWVLLKYRIEFNEYPADVQKLTLRTEPRGCRKLFAYRNFDLTSNGISLAKASSMWALVDFNTMEMVNAENILSSNPYMQTFVAGENDLKFNKISQISKIDYQKEFEVRYNDLDVNMHANNANYIIWALEPLPYKFKMENKLKSIDMVYKKQIKFGEKLVSEVQILEDNTTLHLLKHANTGDELCIIKCEFTL